MIHGAAAGKPPGSPVPPAQWLTMPKQGPPHNHRRVPSTAAIPTAPDGSHVPTPCATLAHGPPRWHPATPSTSVVPTGLCRGTHTPGSGCLSGDPCPTPWRQWVLPSQGTQHSQGMAESPVLVLWVNASPVKDSCVPPSAGHRVAMAVPGRREWPRLSAAATTAPQLITHRRQSECSAR